MKRNVSILAILVFLILIFLIRPVNYDEAYYLIGGQGILEAKLPYKDFLFHQMPFMIYLYAPISDLGYWSLIIGRLTSITLFLFSFIIQHKLYEKYTGNRNYALFATLYFFNLFLIDWVVIIRIYALSIFLLSVGIFYYDKFTENYSKSKYLFLSGLFFSLLVLTKAIFVVNLLVLVLYALYFLYAKFREKLLPNFLFLIGGISIPMLLFIILFVKYPDALYFNIYEVNLLAKKYADMPFGEAFFKYIAFFFLPQNFILILVILVSGLRFSFFESFLIANVSSIILIHIPTRIAPEYLTSIIPFMVLLAVLRYKKFELKVLLVLKLFSNKKLLFSISAIYILLSPLSVAHFKHLIERRNIVLNPVEMYYFQKRVNLLEGTTILSSWEGYSIFSSKKPLYKFNYYTAFITDHISPENQSRYNIKSKEDYRNLIVNKTPDVIVYDWQNSSHLEGFEGLIESNYLLAFNYRSMIVYRRN